MITSRSTIKPLRSIGAQLSRCRRPNASAMCLSQTKKTVDAVLSAISSSISTTNRECHEICRNRGASSMIHPLHGEKVHAARCWTRETVMANQRSLTGTVIRTTTTQDRLSVSNNRRYSFSGKRTSMKQCAYLHAYHKDDWGRCQSDAGQVREYRFPNGSTQWYCEDGARQVTDDGVKLELAGEGR